MKFYKKLIEKIKKYFYESNTIDDLTCCSWGKGITEEEAKKLYKKIEEMWSDKNEKK